MNPDYLALAAKRAATVWPPYRQPEDFGYDFRQWVSPYTKGAHSARGIAIVLQDWASADRLAAGVDPDVQEYGRIRTLLTNRRLEAALKTATGLTLAQTYVTNAFPFVKPGGMSGNLRFTDIVRTAREFTRTELELAKPRLVVALGSLTKKALDRAGIDAIPLPHPAARGMSGEAYSRLWLAGISGRT